MLNFSAISIHDQEKLAPLLADNHARVNERSFASMYVWGRHYGFEICVQENVLFTHCLPADGYRIFLAPIGPGDKAAAFEKMHHDSLRLHQPYQVYCLTADVQNIQQRPHAVQFQPGTEAAWEQLPSGNQRPEIPRRDAAGFQIVFQQRLVAHGGVFRDLLRGRDRKVGGSCRVSRLQSWQSVISLCTAGILLLPSSQGLPYLSMRGKRQRAGHIFWENLF